MDHTRLVTDMLDSGSTSVQLPGAIVDVGVWCVMLIATGCIVWRLTANWRQFRLRTLFGVVAVVAILLGWWKFEHDDPCLRFPDARPVLAAKAPMLDILELPCYVYVPILFALGCGIYWLGSVSGVIVARVIRMGHHASPP